MAREPIRRLTRALDLAAHAWISAPPTTAEEAEICNARLAKARSFLMHTPKADMIVLGQPMSPAEFEALREEAIRQLRRTCGECGGCDKFGLKPP